jgi:outer membrane protein OmpA-like peptidoglycan-associated protein/tetratricopeptide (TPR) repeat protein
MKIVYKLQLKNQLMLMHKSKFLFFVILLLLNTLLYSQKASKLYKLGKELSAEGKIDEAIALFSQAIIDQPSNADYYQARAEMYDKKKLIEKALLDYILSLQFKPKNDGVYLRVADIYIEKNDYPEAILTMKKLLSNSEGSNIAYQKFLNCLMLQKDYNEVLVVCNYVINTYKLRDDFIYHHKLAIAYDSLKNFYSASTEYAKAIETRELLDGKNPNLVLLKPLYVSYGLSNYKVQNYDESLKLFGKAIALDPTDTVNPSNAEIYYLRSFAFLEANDVINSIGDLTRAIALNTTNKKLYLQRAFVFQKVKQYLDAKKDYSSYIKLNDKDASAFANRAFCNMELNNYLEAINDYKQAFDISHKTEYYTSLSQAKKVLLDQNRENDAPIIILEYPTLDKSGYINVIENQYEVLIKGNVRDKSDIDLIYVNNIPAKFTMENELAKFTCHVPVFQRLDSIEILAIDIYGNRETKLLKVGHIANNSRKNVVFAGKVLLDNGSNTPYSNKDLSLVNVFDEIFMKSRTDDSGQFKFENLPMDQNYFLKMDVSDSPYADKQKFKVTNDKNETILTSTEDGNMQYKFQLLPTDVNIMELMTLDDAPVLVDLKGKLIGADDKKTPISNITVYLSNGKGEVVATKKTDASGTFIFTKLLPRENYTIKTDQNETRTIPYDKILFADEKGILIKELVKSTNGTFEYKLLHTDKFQLVKIAESDPWLSTLNLSKDKKELIIIENIYYPSGSYALTSDAELVINKALQALFSNTQISIEVQSHTDALAGDTYNMDLSQKRANAVVNYMINNGIEKSRLKAKGFGETQLTNHCRNGVECSDEEHSQNRRTVFKINYISQ